MFKIATRETVTKTKKNGSKVMDQLVGAKIIPAVDPISARPATAALSKYHQQSSPAQGSAP